MKDNIINCYHCFSGTCVRQKDNKKVPMIGITAITSDSKYVYVFSNSDDAREFCKDLLNICDKLDKEAADE